MAAFVDHPAILFVVLFALLIVAVAFGVFGLRRLAPLRDDERDDFNAVQGATLTLLALLIGFSISMAVNRYDQRKNLEEAEANAIGTEYARADLAEPHIRDSIRLALVQYTRLRLTEFQTRIPDERKRLDGEISALQSKLWEQAAQVAKTQPTPIGALVVAGMNDVLNSQDYSEAARINHIPLGAWVLMILIAVFGCAVQGYGAKGKRRTALLMTILPVTISLSLALIADIDSPRGGIIHVQPQNLTRLLQSLEQ
jgi:FtsH-binding integral membrane protein